jgi:hypothetical protein
MDKGELFNMRTKLFKNPIYGTINKTENVTNGQVGSNVRWSIAKEYLNARTNIHIHIGFDDLEEYCAILDKDSEISCLGNIIEDSRDADFSPESASSEKQVPMFIRVVQDMEIPKSLPEIGVSRTIARLKRIDNSNRCVGHPLELVPLLEFIFVDVVKDRELISMGGFVPFRQNKLIDEMVEGATEVVEHLPNEQTDTARYGRHLLEAVDALSRCVIDIFGDSVRFRATKGRQLSIQYLKVLSGPGKFSFGTFKRGHDDELQT